VLIAFAVTLLIEDSDYAWLADYADPAIVATLIILIIPLPYTTIRDNVKQWLLSAPDKQTQARIHELLAPELEKIQKQDYLVRMTEVGRFLYMQMYIQLTPQSEAKDVVSQDLIRQTISDKLVAEFPNTSIDIIFTLERKWFGNVAQPV